MVCGTFSYDTRMEGDNLGCVTKGVKSPGACCAICMPTPGCVGFEYREKGGRCRLKSAIGTIKENKKGFVIGLTKEQRERLSVIRVLLYGESVLERP